MKGPNMKTVAFVPIKLNNQRAPGKNIKRFDDGTALITYFLAKLNKIETLDEIYVFCSDDSIKDYMIPQVKFLKRPQYLDSQKATPQDIIKEFMNLIDADIYMVSHCTSPFVSIKHFTDCIDVVKSGQYDSAFTGEKMQKLLWRNDRKPLNFNAESVPRTQDLEPIYNEISAAYVFTKQTFQTYNRRIGINPYISVVNGIECIDIDYPEDFEIANAIYTQILKKGEMLNESCENT